MDPPTINDIYRVVAPRSIHRGELGLKLVATPKTLVLLNVSIHMDHEDERNELTRRLRPREVFTVSRRSVRKAVVCRLTEEEQDQVDKALKASCDYLAGCSRKSPARSPRK